MNHDYFVNLSKRAPHPENVEAITVHYHYGAAVESEDKDRSTELRNLWANWRLDNSDVTTDALSLWSSLTAPVFDLRPFPPYTLTLQFPFRLTKAYMSRDERGFYIVDNPVRRDRVFDVPLVAPSTWKGSLRAALWQLGHDASQQGIRRLFGNEKGADEDFRAGRLRCFPTYFKQHGLEIINPHDRERRVGTKPILFESVPPGTTGLFSLLYVPFDRIGQDDAETRQEVADDFDLVADGVESMFCTYGFGAKTSSGFGAAVRNFADKITRRREDFSEPEIQLKAILCKPEEIRAFETEYGPLDQYTHEQWRELLMTDAERRDYQAAREAYPIYQDNVRTGQVTQEIESFNEMAETLKNWAAALREEVSGE